MTWGAISAIADLLASIGVIVSLIYVAVQLKINGKLISTNNYYQNREFASGAIDLIAGNAELADIYLRGLQAYAELNDNEKMRFHMLMTKWVGNIESILEARGRGLIDKKMFSEQLSVMQVLFESPGAVKWWREEEKWFHRATADQINQIIQNSVPVSRGN